MAAGIKAQEQGVAGLRKGADLLHQDAVKRMREAREATYLLMREGLIPAPDTPGPEEDHTAIA
jgi:hypothetical protein